MQSQIEKLQNDLEERDQTIQQILCDKSEAAKAFSVLEAKYSTLQQTIQFLDTEKQERDKALENMQLLLAA